MPHFITDKCIGCSVCEVKCPTNTIWGTARGLYYIHPERCIDCSVCGIYTHHRRRSNPRQFGVNAACIEGVSPFDFPEIPVTDGVHHASDMGAGAKPRQAGVLRYEPAKD